MTDRARVLMAFGFVAVAGLLGYSVATGQFMPVGVVLALIGVVAASKARPWVAFVVLVSVSSFVAVYAWPRVPIAGDGVYLSELILLVAVAATFPAYVDLVIKGRIRVDWIAMTIGALFVVSVVAIAVGVLRGAAIGLAFFGFRAMLYLLLYIPAMVALSHGSPMERAIAIMMIIGIAVSIAAVAQFIVGSDRLLFVIGSFDALVREDPSTGFLRIRPPGLYLIYSVVIWSAACILWGGSGLARRLAPLGLVLGAAAIALSFNRNMLVGVVIGLGVAFVGGRRRSRAVVAGVSIALIAVLFVTVSGSLQIDPRLVGRFTSLLNEQSRSSALSDRAYETGFAIRTISENPIFGIGWGTGYGALATRSTGGIISSFERPWLHNQYLNQWMRTGIVGGLLLLVLMIGLIVSEFRNMREAEHGREWLHMGLLASLVAFALSALVDIVIANPNNLAVLILMAAMVSAGSLGRLRLCRDDEVAQ